MEASFHQTAQFHGRKARTRSTDATWQEEAEYRSKETPELNSTEMKLKLTMSKPEIKQQRINGASRTSWSTWTYQGHPQVTTAILIRSKVRRDYRS